MSRSLAYTVIFSSIESFLMFFQADSIKYIKYIIAYLGEHSLKDGVLSLCWSPYSHCSIFPSILQEQQFGFLSQESLSPPPPATATSCTTPPRSMGGVGLGLRTVVAGGADGVGGESISCAPLLFHSRKGIRTFRHYIRIPTITYTLQRSGGRCDP